MEGGALHFSMHRPANLIPSHSSQLNSRWVDVWSRTPPIDGVRLGQDLRHYMGCHPRSLYAKLGLFRRRGIAPWRAPSHFAMDSKPWDLILLLAPMGQLGTEQCGGNRPDN
jgi:hypothetical protein